MPKLRVCALIVVGVGAARRLFGQATFGSLLGTVTDPAGAVILNAGRRRAALAYQCTPE